jgi:hypothetical protein
MLIDPTLVPFLAFLKGNFSIVDLGGMTNHPQAMRNSKTIL